MKAKFIKRMDRKPKNYWHTGFTDNKLKGPFTKQKILKLARHVIDESEYNIVLKNMIRICTHSPRVLNL